VAARTSAFSFKDKQAGIREIGEKLNVRTLLEGSVKKAGERIRITAQLVNVEDGFHLWSERFDLKMDDVFAIQDEISFKIAEKLKLKLASGEKALMVKRYTQNTDAYLAYLKGRHLFQSMGDFEKAIGSLQEAIAIDPNYAPAHAMLANVYGNVIAWGGQPKGRFLPLMKDATYKALELDSSSAEARGAFAFLKWFEFDWSFIDRETAHAIELNPALPEVHVFRATLFLGMIGRIVEALSELHKALELDPLSAWVHYWLGHAYYCSRSKDEAVQHLEMSLQLDPDMGISHWWLGLTYLQEGMFEEASTHFETIGAAQHPFVLASVGQKDQAVKALETWEGGRTAQTLLALGERDKAVEELERAFWDPDTPIWGEECALVNDPLWDPLRDHPRFQDLLRRLGLEPRM
jgi:tetratricopeptide (TPR) repeat protein